MSEDNVLMWPHLPPNNVTDTWLARLIMVCRGTPYMQPSKSEVEEFRKALMRERERRRRLHPRDRRSLARRLAPYQKWCPSIDEMIAEFLCSVDCQGFILLIDAVVNLSELLGMLLVDRFCYAGSPMLSGADRWVRRRLLRYLDVKLRGAPLPPSLSTDEDRPSIETLSSARLLPASVLCACNGLRSDDLAMIQRRLAGDRLGEQANAILGELDEAGWRVFMASRGAAWPHLEAGPPLGFSWPGRDDPPSPPPQTDDLAPPETTSDWTR